MRSRDKILIPIIVFCFVSLLPYISDFWGLFAGENNIPYSIFSLVAVLAQFPKNKFDMLLIHWTNGIGYFEYLLFIVLLLVGSIYSLVKE